MGMITACVARRHQRCPGRVEFDFRFMLQAVRPIGKTRNQLHAKATSSGPRGK